MLNELDLQILKEALDVLAFKKEYVDGYLALKKVVDREVKENGSK